jgi:hypothetical protein
MRAISIQQPWAWLIVNGHKPIENRDWPTKVRGWVAIHASKKFDMNGYGWVLSRFPKIALPRPDEFERGGIVGRARLTDCIDYSESAWFTGTFGFVFADAEPVTFQPCRGMLGFFTPQLPDARA